MDQTSTIELSPAHSVLSTMAADSTRSVDPVLDQSPSLLLLHHHQTVANPSVEMSLRDQIVVEEPLQQHSLIAKSLVESNNNNSNFDSVISPLISDPVTILQQQVTLESESQPVQCNQTGEKELDDDGDDNDDVCCICLDPFSATDPAITTKCHHRFHLQCTECWLQRSHSCPLCWKQLRYEWEDDSISPPPPPPPPQPSTPTTTIPPPAATAQPNVSTPTPAPVPAPTPVSNSTPAPAPAMATTTTANTVTPRSHNTHSHFRHHRDGSTSPVGSRPMATLGSFLCKIGTSLWKQLNTPTTAWDESPPTL